MYKIETKDEYDSVIREYESPSLEDVRELIVELIEDSEVLPRQIKVYQEVKFSCSISAAVEFTN